MSEKILESSATNELGKDAPLTAVQEYIDKRPGESYWSLVKHQYKKNKLAVLALYLVIAMGLVAVFADFIANDKPLIASYNGSMYFPVVKDYMVGLGISRWSSDLVLADWREIKLDWALSAPHPVRIT